MNEIRRPCVPSVQSIGSATGSKSASNVKLQERLGSRVAGMGEKRVSSSAEVRAYVERPVDRGRASKVPMQPRRLLLPDREMVFHVTNNG